jgi:signal recognition particle receptor subunit beta
MRPLPEILDFLSKSPIRISVFGEFSAGKSTFINALIGEDILSVAVEPTTAVPTYVRYAREFNIFVHQSNGTVLKLFESDPPFWTRFVGRESVLNTLQKQRQLIRDFLKTWTKEGERAGEVTHISIELPLEWLKSGIELVDTPGTNNEFAQHHNFTSTVAKDTDIAILLMDARQGGGKRTEFEVMNTINKQVGKSLVVLNKIDTLDEDERNEVKEFVKTDALPKHWDGAVVPEVFGLSALVRISTGLAEKEPSLVAAFLGFMRAIEGIVKDERGKILLHRLGNPEQELFNAAKQREAEKDHDKAHKLYFDLHDVLKAAGLDEKPALDGIERCEEHLRGKVKTLDDVNKIVNDALALEQAEPDKALSILEETLARMDEMGARDEDVALAVKRLSERISDRDKAQRKIINVMKAGKQAFDENDYIKAVDEICSITDLYAIAELTEDQINAINETIGQYTQQRYKWAQEMWRRVERIVADKLIRHEYNELQEDTAILDKIVDYLVL